MMNENETKNSSSIEFEDICKNHSFDLDDCDSQVVHVHESLKSYGVRIGRKRLMLTVGFAFVFLASIGVTQLHIHNKSAPSISSISENQPESESGFQTITVDVHGDVVHPGIYHLPMTGRVLDAIAAAGGFIHSKDSQNVNQAQPLVDGQEIIIADAVSQDASPSASVQNADNQQESTSKPKIDLNTADVATLETVSGIGPKRAEAIVSYRNEHGPFRKVTDLRHIRGIGKATVARLELYLFVQ